MAQRLCKYYNCPNTSETHSLFRFPVNDENRLQIWIKNSGNPKLTKLTPDKLKNYFICADHFDKCFINPNEHRVRGRIVGTAIPRLYEGEIGESNSTECGKDKSNEVEPDNEGSDNESVKATNTKGVNAFDILCSDCEKPIRGYGFQWWCLHCSGRCCGPCAMREHRPHLVLRSPANTPHEQVEVVIAAIRKELQLKDFLKTRAGHVDQDESAGVDFHESVEREIEEALVKAEPPDEAEDPLAETSTSNLLKKLVDLPTNDLNDPIDCQTNSQSNVSRPDEDTDSDCQLNEETRDPLEYGDSEYQPSQISSGLEDSIEFLSHKSKNVVQLSQNFDPQLDYPPSLYYLSLDDLNRQKRECVLSELCNNFGIYSLYDETDLVDVRPSASLQSAPIGPTFAVPDDEDNPNEQQPSDEDLRPPCTKRTRIQTDLKDDEMDVENITTTYTEVDDRLQQPNQAITTEEENSAEIMEHNDDEPIMKAMPLSRIYFKHKKKLTELDTRRQNVSHSKTRQPQILIVSNHIIQNCTNITQDKNCMKQKSMKTTIDNKESQQPQKLYSKHKIQNCTKKSHNQRKPLDTTEKLIEPYRANQPQKAVYSRINQQDRMNVIQTYDSQTKSVNTIHNSNNDTHEKQQPKIADNFTDEENDQNKIQQTFIEVHSTHNKNQNDTAITKNKEIKILQSINITEISENPITRPKIQIYSTHANRKLHITDKNGDNGTQQPHTQINSTHQSIDTIEHNIVSKTQQSGIETNITYNNINTESTSQNSDASETQQPQIQVYSTHKARQPKT